MPVVSCVSESSLYFEVFLLIGDGINSYLLGNCCILLVRAAEH